MILKYPYIDQFIIKSKCKCKELLHVYKKSIISFFFCQYSPPMCTTSTSLKEMQ